MTDRSGPMKIDLRMKVWFNKHNLFPSDSGTAKLMMNVCINMYRGMILGMF